MHKLFLSGEIKYVTVQPAPFGKPHCVLTAAATAVFLINRRSVHRAALAGLLLKY